MPKIRSARRTIAMTAATLALAGGTAFYAASSASASVTKTICNGDYLRIWRGSATQCFYYNPRTAGNYLNVNDWYDGVSAGPYTVDVKWHDLATDRWFQDTIYPTESYNQPTFNSVLYSVVFHNTGS